MQTLFDPKVWPPRYFEIFQWRQQKLLQFRKNPSTLTGALEYYRHHASDFIVHWGDTYDPRNAGRPNKLSWMPFQLFERQVDLVDFLQGCLDDEENGLIEKSRDMGATWLCGWFSVWLWRFHPGSAIGWGSRKEQLVDKLGDPDSIFEKLRMSINRLPREFRPSGFKAQEHMNYMRIVNPENGSTITGEVGDNIGRGGRKLIYFKDESAHYVRPKLIEAALGDNTRCQIDLSSVNGLGNVFHNRREAGEDWEPGKEMTPGKTRVFVFDWSDHPEKTQEWYDKRRKKAEEEGLLREFFQEVDRNYASSVDGVIIKPEWVDACFDAHIALDLAPTGKAIVGLDVADDGTDTNAFTGRKGVLCFHLQEWGGFDTGETAREAISISGELGCRPCEIHYDANGLGAGIKAEANRLKQAKLYTEKQVKFVPWSAAGKLKDPTARIVPGDKEAPLNEDYFQNYKAQAWWNVARKMENTWKCINDPFREVVADEIISISTDIPKPLRQKLKKELCQVTRKQSSSLKMMIDKKPEGTKSPNVGDSFVQAFFPVVKPVRGLF